MLPIHTWRGMVLTLEFSIYDEGTGDFLVLQLDKGAQLSYRIVKANGKIEKPYTWSKKIDKLFSVATILPNKYHKYVLGVTENSKVEKLCSSGCLKNRTHLLIFKRIMQLLCEVP